jgi:hypothetical protein
LVAITPWGIVPSSPFASFLIHGWRRSNSFQTDKALARQPEQTWWVCTANCPSVKGHTRRYSLVCEKRDLRWQIAVRLNLTTVEEGDSCGQTT